MDTLGLIFLALVGLVLVWFVVRAFRNARHSPSTSVRGGPGTGGQYESGPGGGTAFLDPGAPGKPRSGRSGDQTP